MENLDKQTVGSTVAGDYRIASVFQKYGIDFCCHGGQTIEEACAKKGIDKNKLLSEISSAVASANTTEDDFNLWELNKLADYIEQKHHQYVVKQTPVLLQFLEKICNVHGGKHPELFEIQTEFKICAQELAMHMKKEEIKLFPAIKKLVAVKENKANRAQLALGMVNNLIDSMMSDHESEGERFERIKKLSNGYTTPTDGCSTYNATYQTLKEFEEDLHKHIHLENNILFPKAIELENSFK